MRAGIALSALTFLAALVPRPACGQKVATPSLDQLATQARADSINPASHYRFAMALWEKKDWDRAETSLRNAIRLDTMHADAYLALSRIPYLRTDKYWKKVVEQQGDSTIIRAVRESALFERRAFLLNPMLSLKSYGRYQGPDPAIVLNFPGLGVFGAAQAWVDLLRSGIDDLYSGKYPRAWQRLEWAKRDMIRQNPDGTPFPSILLWHHALAAAHVDSFDVAVRELEELRARVAAAESKDGAQPAILRANDYRFIGAAMLCLGGHAKEASAGFQASREKDPALPVPTGCS